MTLAMLDMCNNVTPNFRKSSWIIVFVLRERQRERERGRKRERGRVIQGRKSVCPFDYAFIHVLTY